MNPIQRIRLTLAGQTPDRPARGEVWIGPAVFAGVGLDDDLDGQIALRRRMGMDAMWLSIGLEDGRHCQGYRVFSPSALTRAKESCDLFVGAVMDGPWQRLADKMGLMELVMALALDRECTARSLAREAAAAMAIIEQCLAQGADGLIVADDLAGQAGPFISPRDIDSLLAPFYDRAGRAIRSSESLALFHCCGNPSRLMDVWARAGFQGLAAVQTECLPVGSLAEHFGPCPVLVGGLDAPVHCESITPDVFISEVDSLVAVFRLILSTSSGIHSWEQAERLMAIYDSWTSNGI